MKKRLAAGMVFLIIMSFFGCTAAKAPVKPLWSFDCSIDINDGAVTGTGSFGDTKTITVNSPKSLEGMTFTLAGSIITAEVGGLSKSSDSEPAVADFLPSQTLSLIVDLSSSPLNFVSQGENKTMYTAGDATVVVDDKGYLTYIKSGDITVRFISPLQTEAP